MHILIADPDRDFLLSYKTLLELSENSVQTAFDGTQVIEKLASERFDAVILNESIPRIRYSEIVKVLREDNIPVLVISERAADTTVMSIRLPFMPVELTEKLAALQSRGQQNG